MNYSLDTNAVTDFLHNDRNVIGNMERAMLNDDTIFIDPIVYYEISRCYNQLRNGRLIEDNDIFIAAMAMVNDCVLVTANEKHFNRIEGLRYVNWRL